MDRRAGRRVHGIYYRACAQKGLAIHTDITYANLPTITSINKNFYETWPGPMKHKEVELDNIKHKDSGGFVYTDGSAPIHLCAELQVIEKAIDVAATELALHHCKSFIITSDHGASRLAVIHKQEEKYETDTKESILGVAAKNSPMPICLMQSMKMDISF